MREEKRRAEQRTRREKYSERIRVQYSSIQGTRIGLTEDMLVSYSCHRMQRNGEQSQSCGARCRRESNSYEWNLMGQNRREKERKEEERAEDSEMRQKIYGVGVLQRRSMAQRREDEER